MKKLMVTAVAVAALAGIAFDALAEEAEVEAEECCWNNWRITVGGFGRGNMRAKVLGLGSERVTAYGADLDLQYSVWQNERFNVWAGIGGTFCPRQNVSDSYNLSESRSEHQVSADTYVTYDFNSHETTRADVELGYGELRLMMVPEWKITDSLSLGARIGVALDWISAECSRRSDWSWNSTFNYNFPGVPPYSAHDGDSGVTSRSDSQTEFAAQAILGLQATYMFTDLVGLYANFDWRLGGETDFDMGADNGLAVDMSGWYWGVGVVLSF